MSTESLKTILFVGMAGIAALSAGWSYYANRPPQTTGFELVGQPFFENFDDSRTAAYLEISALDENGDLQTFVLQKWQGIWRIPTHSDYPAEAVERLANVSTALIGLTREAVVGRIPDEHRRFGVRDPKELSFGDAETAGTRLLLRDESGRTLADLIIGRAVEQGDLAVTDTNFSRPRRNEFYVRRVGESQTYKTTLNLSLSTKFSDWIDTRLIALEAPEVVGLKIDNYQLVNNPRDPLGTSRFKQTVDQVNLMQTESNRWEMQGLDVTKERVKEGEVNDLIDTLINLEIVGVREKFRHQGKALIGADMRIAEIPELRQDDEQFGRLLQSVALDMSRRGFYLQAPEQGGDVNTLQLISEFGQVSFTTNEGYVFYLDLGKSIEGDSKAIEIGSADMELDGQTPDASDDSEKNLDDDPSATKPKSSGKNRFVLIRVGLDESRVAGGPPQKPTPPIAPTKPEGYTPALAELKPQTDAAQDKKEDANQDDAPPPVEAIPHRDAAFEKYDQDVLSYESEKIQYEINLSRYEDALSEYNAAVEEAKTKVAELNERYGAWYYVVSALNLENLRTDRSALIEKFEVPPAEGPTDSAAKEAAESIEMQGVDAATDEAKEKASDGDQKSEDGDTGGTQDDQVENDLIDDFVNNENTDGIGRFEFSF